MVTYVITFFLQVLTYVVLQLDSFYVASGVSLLSIMVWFLIIIILFLIIRRLMNSNGIG